MKSLLVPVEVHDRTAATLATACLLARIFDSTVEGLWLRPAFVPPLGIEPASAIVVEGPELDDEAAPAEARARFLSAMEACGVGSGAGAAGGGPRAIWNEERGADDEFVASYARIFDATIVGRPDGRIGAPRMTTLEAALFESGRPIVIAPPETPASLGTAVALAWNGSTETARTLAFAMPLIRQASRVVILCEEDERRGPSGQQVRRHLLQGGVETELRTMAASSMRSGDAILSAAAEIGCDLLVKGAYTQSRLRQLIFGGATSGIIARTTIPVFMAH